MDYFHHRYLLKYMNKIYHIDATSPILRLLPNHRTTSNPEHFTAINLPKYSVVGMMITESSTTRQKTTTNKLLQKIITRKRFVFVTLGSFGKYIINAFSEANWLASWEAFGKQHNCDVLLHGNINTDTLFEYVQVINGYVDYESVLTFSEQNKKTTLWQVFFTGSAVLQNMCWACNTPMCFVPYLSEQFFFASVYKAHTGKPFVNYLDSQESLITQLNHCIVNRIVEKRLHAKIQKMLMTQIGKTNQYDKLSKAQILKLFRRNYSLSIKTKLCGIRKQSSRLQK